MRKEDSKQVAGKKKVKLEAMEQQIYLNQCPFNLGFSLMKQWQVIREADDLLTPAALNFHCSERGDHPLPLSFHFFF